MRTFFYLPSFSEIDLDRGTFDQEKIKKAKIKKKRSKCHGRKKNKA